MTKRITTYIPPGSDEVTEKFVNYIMIQGKKNTARRIFRDMLEEIGKRGHKNPQEVFFRAIDSAKPGTEVRPKRVGGSIYQVPFEVGPKRQQMLAFRWILTAARGTKGIPMFKKLAQVILNTAENTGPAVKKKEDVEKMAQANRAFSHYAKFTKRK